MRQKPCIGHGWAYMQVDMQPLAGPIDRLCLNGAGHSLRPPPGTQTSDSFRSNKSLRLRLGPPPACLRNGWFGCLAGRANGARIEPPLLIRFDTQSVTIKAVQRQFPDLIASPSS
jgi:hypothetical protein